jgi:beta-galactosidase
VSEQLIYGEENKIEICLDNSDNSEVPPGKPQGDLDFTYEGGLYRDAWILVSDKLYITHPLLANEVAGGGVFVWYSDVTEQCADVNFKVQIRNDHFESKDFLLKTSVIDIDGSIVGEYISNNSLESNNSVYVNGLIKVQNPYLWSPETPNLYTLRCEIICCGEIVFTKDTEIGIRTFEFTVDNGVIFNGKSRRFNGGNYHQNWPYIGNGVPNSLLIRDIMKIKEMGMDNIRSHYPFCSAFTDACNRLGMTIIVSNVGWQFCRPGIFLERTLQNMRDIIRWQRNNPCVLMWEPILNESEMSYEVQLAFHNATHEEYPYSPCYTASDYGPTDVAYHDYDPNMLGNGMEKYGLIARDDSIPRPCWTREYGDWPDDFFNQSTIWRCTRGWGDFAMSEAVNRMLHRFDSDISTSNQYIDVVNNKRLCGFGVWPAIAHNRGYHINPCWGGHLDLFRLPKFSYYFMRSQIDREVIGDVLFVANWWGETSPVDVTVYSNAEKVQLFCNDKFIAEQYPDDINVKHPPFTFKDIKRKFKTIARSVLTVKALVNDEVVAERKVKAPGVANHMKLEADFMGVPLKADGSDIVAVRCYMLDSDGGIAPLTGDVHPIHFEIEGEGEIIGDASIGANPICAEAGIATVLVRSTQKAGKITLKAKMLWPFGNAEHGDIKPAEITFESI